MTSVSLVESKERLISMMIQFVLFIPLDKLAVFAKTLFKSKQSLQLCRRLLLNAIQKILKLSLCF